MIFLAGDILDVWVSEVCRAVLLGVVDFVSGQVGGFVIIPSVIIFFIFEFV